MHAGHGIFNYADNYQQEKCNLRENLLSYSCGFKRNVKGAKVQILTSAFSFKAEPIAFVCACISIGIEEGPGGR